MAPNPEFYNSADSATISAPITASVTAGSSLATVEYHLWNWKGGAGSTLTRARLRAVGFDGTNKVTEGLPGLDEKWLQIRLIGMNNAGSASMEAQTSGWVPLGTNSSFPLKDIPQNCARHIEVKYVVPAGAANNTQQLYLELVYDENSAPLSQLVSLASGGGVIPDWFDTSNLRVTRGRIITAAGTDVITVTKGGWVDAGVPFFRIADSITLNQTAADGALTAGQSYIATISQPPPTVGTTNPAIATKGNRGASPTAPATPAGNIFLGWVTVTYQAGGTSIINQANVDTTTVVQGELNIVASATGLSLIVGAGRAMSDADTVGFHSARTTVSVSAAHSYLWLNADGTFSSHTVSDSPPNAGGILLAGYTNDGANITGVTDERTYTGHETHTLTLRYYGASPAGSIVTADYDALKNGAWVLESYAVHALSIVNGANVKYDILSNFTGSFATIFVNNATSDLRPILAQSAFDTSEIAADHERWVFGSDGTLRFKFDFVSGTEGGATDSIVKLHFRRVR